MKAVLAVVGVVVAVAAIVLLREATMSRHVAVDPASRMDVVVRGSSNVEAADVEKLVTALMAVCELEVRTDVIGGPERLGGDVFAFRLQPALDDTDQLQLTGCMEDARLDRLQTSVLSLERIAPDAP